MHASNVQVVADLKLFLHTLSSDPALRTSYVSSPGAFTRRRSLPFGTVALLVVNLLKRSLSVELSSFFGLLQRQACSKAAFCQQRAKLSARFFADWNGVLVESFYRHYGAKAKRWRGFTLLAIDGSTLTLPNTPTLRAAYGCCSSRHGEHSATARSAVLYDVLNELVVDGCLHPYLSSERSAVLPLLEGQPTDSLLLFDRGYPSYALFHLLMLQQRHFVMRLRTDFNAPTVAFMGCAQQDAPVSFSPGGEARAQLKAMGYPLSKEASLTLRMVKVTLPTGEVELLATNLYDGRTFTSLDLAELYRLRWGVETCYGTLKNQLQLEAFSGLKLLCVEQDFYAHLFVLNLQSLLQKQCQPGVDRANKRRRLTYRVNKNRSWATLKDRIVQLFLEREGEHLLLELQALFEQHLEPVRKNRSYPRTCKSKNANGKYATYNNYKRAI